MLSFAKKPPLWIAAHRAVDFTFNYESRTIINTGTINNPTYSTKLAVQTSLVFNDTPAAGDLIWIDSGVYAGYHTVLLNALGLIVTSTEYTTNQTSGTVKLVKPYTFKIYKGYQTGPFATYHPYTEIAEFKPEPNPQGQLSFNICGYINKIFDTLNSNETAQINNAIVYYNLFNRITLELNGTNQTLLSTHIALNSALTTFELNRDYVDTLKHLNSGPLRNFYKSCGISENMLISGTLVVQDAQVFDEAVAPPLGSYNNQSYSQAYNKPG